MPPLTQGPSPDLNRAWSRRGWATAPYFAKTVSRIMAETTINVTRRVRTLSAGGGFGAGAPVAIYSGPAHVEWVEDPEPKPTGGGDVEDEVLGTTVHHHYEIYVDVAPTGGSDMDSASFPQTGDRVTFNDGYRAFDLPIIRVRLNAGLTDHWEAITDDIEAT